MKTWASILVFFAAVVVVALAGHTENSCIYCRPSERCYTCDATDNVYCTYDWSWGSTCCSAGLLIVRYCNGSGCCSLTKRILLYIGIAAAVIAVFVVAFIIFWCIRTRRNRVEYGGFQSQPSEVVEVHHYNNQPQYGTVTTTTVGSPAQVGYQAAPAGYQPAPGYTY